jgi:hypothetical protein
MRSGLKSSSQSSGLLRALRQLLPEASLSVIHERAWYSLTFSGVHLYISLILTAEHHADLAIRFAEELPEHEFNLYRQLVADIAVIQWVAGKNQSRLMIDALLLDV